MTNALGLECLHLSEELAALCARSDAAKSEAEARVRTLAHALSARASELRAVLEREDDSRRAVLAARARDVMAVMERVQAVHLLPTPVELPRDLRAELSAACADLAAARRAAPPPPPPPPRDPPPRGAPQAGWGGGLGVGFPAR